MKKLILALLFISGTLFSQTGASFKFGDISSWWTPKVFMYGNSTYWHDSTNYQTTNKSVYILDSLKVGKDLYVGVRGGAIYMDTSRGVSLQITGSDLVLDNSKSSGTLTLSSLGYNEYIAISKHLFTTTSGFFEYYDNLGHGFTVNSTGLFLNLATTQIKLPSDTASDYDANDAVTINRQSGVITTKSLTTATDNFYTFTLTNSLISATSKVFLSYCGGTESAGRPMVYRVVSGSGSATCIILNLAGAGSFNGNIKFNFVVFN